MDINEEISLLKAKINLELQSLKYHKELSTIVDDLKAQVNSFDVEKKGLPAYRAFLEVFLEFSIKKVNSIIAEGKENIYDDRSQKLIDKVEEQEKEIEKTISYLNEHMPSIGKIAEEEYTEIKERHYSKLEDSFEYNKSSLAQYLGIRSTPNLSIYGTTSRLFNTYSIALEVLKTTSLDEFKKFAENDQKIKESFARAKGLFKDDDVYADIEKVEKEYLTMLEDSTSSYLTFRNSGIIKLQNHMLETAAELDDKSEKREKYNSYKEYLYSLTFNNIDFDKLLEVQKYVNDNDILEEEFYNVLYTIVEKEKFGCIKYDQKSELLDKLSRETLFKLETKYVDRISLLSEEEIPEALREYKEKGYLHSMDKTILKSFEEDGIKNSPFIIFHAEEKKPEPKKEKRDKTALHLIGDKICENYPRDKKIDKFLDDSVLEEIDDRVFKAAIPSKVGEEYYYFDEEGKRIDTIPSNVDLVPRVANFFVASEAPLRIYDKSLGHLLFKEDNGETSYKDNSMDYVKDENNKVVLIRNKTPNEQFLYKFDYDGHLLGSYKVSDMVSNISKKRKTTYTNGQSYITYYKDDVIGLQLQNGSKYYKCLYNLEEDCEIIHFSGDTVINDSSYFDVFSDGRVDFYSDDDEDHKGYIDPTGEQVIKGQYLEVSRFAGGIAYVKDQDGVHHLIDIWGTDIPNDETDLENKEYSFNPDVANDRFIVKKPSGNYWSMRAGVKITIDTKRHLINYLKPKQKEKVKQLKKDAS